jgi:hypothetical protein
MMKRIVKNMLGITFIIDALIAIAFGLYSWFFPYETFGTIISIPEIGSSAFVAILSSLSVFYILIGLTCFVGFKASFPVNTWIGLIMIARHLLEGAMKISDIGKEWFIGNPYPDIIIHAVFIFVYVVAIYLKIESLKQK